MAGLDQELRKPNPHLEPLLVVAIIQRLNDLSWDRRKGGATTKVGKVVLRMLGKAHVVLHLGALPCVQGALEDDQWVERVGKVHAALGRL